MEKNNRKIFIGGYGGSGTRVISIILERAGYNVGTNINNSYDYMPVLGQINECWYEDKCNFTINEKTPFAIKHGQLMFVILELKKFHPRSKFILVVRNGLDNILKYQFKWEDTYCKDFVFGNTTLERKMMSWSESYKLSVNNSDYIIRLEDLCYNTIDTIKKLFTYLHIDKDPNDFKSLVHIPESIGRREQLSEHDRRKLYMTGKDMMDYFGYTH